MPEHKVFELTRSTLSPKLIFSHSFCESLLHSVSKNIGKFDEFLFINYIIILDFKLSPCFDCSFFSFG